jgi:amidase
MADDGYVGSTAADIADHVRSGKASPVEIVGAHIDRINAINDRLEAFQVVRAERALAEAEALSRRADLGELPLAGVPVAIKDNLAVEGEPRRSGSGATNDAPQPADHEVVRRLRAAGAIVVGITRMPEFGVFPMTDGVFGTTRNPWNVDRTPGGSSGGSGAAVAAKMVPFAVGNDGFGSIRIPSAACGLFGIKPGFGLVPANVGPNDWFEMEENGPLATTVDDAALAFSVMAAKPDLAIVREPGHLRIAVSGKSPSIGVRVAPAWRDAARATGAILQQAGHAVAFTEPKYPTAAMNQGLFRWFTGVTRDIEGLEKTKILRRTRTHAALGRRTKRFVHPKKREKWRAFYQRFFDDFDVLITPTLARTPPAASGWKDKGWFTNLRVSAAFAPFNGMWNMVGFPAASVPAGLDATGMPIAVQVVGPPEAEARLLSLAKQLEQLRPWTRHAPI